MRDKSTTGPFGAEGDIYGDWRDSKSGYRCVALVGPMLNLNGYVAVESDHPWYKMGYNEHVGPPCGDEWCWDHRIDSLVRVHGGLTYSGTGLPGWQEGEWWFGFDTAHAGDHVPALDGYDLPFKRGDQLRSPEYVGAECSSLAHQLYDIARGGFQSEREESGS